jgi:hypothetical protein
MVAMIEPVFPSRQLRLAQSPPSPAVALVGAVIGIRRRVRPPDAIGPE